MTYTPPAPPYAGPVAHSSGTGNLVPTRVVIHCTASPVDAGHASGTARYFQDPAATGSAHYVVDPTTTLQCAYDNVVCWHAPPNAHSLGIEIECSLANDGKGHWDLASHVAMMHRAATLTAEKCVQYGIPAVKLSLADLVAGKRGVCGHVDVTNAFHQSTHTDPGPYFPWATFMDLVRTEVDRIHGVITPPPPPPPEDSMSAAEVQDLKNFIEARTQAYAVANNDYTRQVVSSATKTILDQISEVDAETATAVQAKLDDDFKALSDQILAQVPPAPVVPPDPPKA